MIKSKLLIFVIILTLFSCTQKTDNLKLLKSYVPLGKSLESYNMLFYAPEEAQTIGTKIQLAISNNRDHFMPIISNLKPGEPFPYDSKLGITREEYDRFNKYTSVQEYRRAEKQNLTFEIVNNKLYMKFDNKDNPLNELFIDLENMHLYTPYGILKNHEKMSKEDAPIGSFEAIYWELKDLPARVDLNNLNGKAIKFSIGYLKNINSFYVYYDVKVVQNNQKEVFYKYIQYRASE